MSLATQDLVDHYISGELEKVERLAQEGRGRRMSLRGKSATFSTIPQNKVTYKVLCSKCRMLGTHSSDCPRGATKELLQQTPHQGARWAVVQQPSQQAPSQGARWAAEEKQQVLQQAPPQGTRWAAEQQQQPAKQAPPQGARSTLSAVSTHQEMGGKAASMRLWWFEPWGKTS